MALLAKKELSCRHDRSEFTHPIRESKFYNPTDLFDKLIYIKGAYIIKQLESIVEESLFWKAMNDYMKKYSWGNSTIDKMFEVLETHYIGK